jgi:hypothetical protein
MRVFIFGFLLACTLSASVPQFIHADQFLEQIASGERPVVGKLAKVYFSPGKTSEVPPLLQKLLIRLSAEGAEVEAKLVTEKEFAAITSESPSEAAYQLSGFELDNAKSGPRSLTELLGIPKGVAPLTLNPAKPLRHFSAAERSLFYETSLIHNAILLTGLSLANKISLVPSAVLSIYFYQVFSNLKSVFDFKGQGAMVVRHQSSLEIDVNPYFLALVNLAEEVAVNGSLAASIPSEGGLSIQDTLSSSFAFGLAKTSVDQYAARMERRIAKALSEGKEDVAKTLKNQQLFILRLFFNGLVPMVRTVAMLTEKTPAGPYCADLKSGTIALAGCHALYQEVVRMTRLRFTGKKYAGSSCAQAIVAISAPLSKPLPPANDIEYSF